MKHSANYKTFSSAKHQAGLSLMETMVSLALSVIVVTSMVSLMGNSMHSATRIIQMTQLSDELRNTMSMMTRDVRRANYNPYSLYCYSNSDCGVSDTTTKTNFIGDLQVVDFNGNDCLRFLLEREDPTGTPGAVEGGAFRKNVTGGVGRVEIWTGDAAPPADCSGDSWVPVTDPSFVNITEFDVTDDPAETGTFSGTVKKKDGSVLLTMRTRQVRMDITGELIIDPDISRTISDTIRVRNDYIATP